MGQSFVKSLSNTSAELSDSENTLIALIGFAIFNFKNITRRKPSDNINGSTVGSKTFQEPGWLYGLVSTHDGKGLLLSGCDQGKTL